MSETTGFTKGQGLPVPPPPKRINLGRSWFLGIAINDYQHWPQLNNAVKDVDDIAQLLLSGYDIEEECCTIIKNDAATENGIIRQLEHLRANVTNTDKVLIYYSGHGHLKHGKRGCWIPQDAEKEAPDKFINNSLILEYLEDINSLHTLLITDACFSGSLFMKGTTRSEAHAMEELEQKPSRWAICSGRHDEEVHDGPPGENSPFAKALLSILSENTRDLLNVGALVERVIHQTRTQYKQLPLGSPVTVTGHKWGEYIFKRLLDEDTFWQKTLAKGTIGDLSNYMQKFPQGKHLEAATRAVEAIEEQEAWLKASKKHESLAYQTFLTKFPRGFFMTPASILLKSSTEVLLEKKAKSKGEMPEKAEKPSRSAKEEMTKEWMPPPIDLIKEEEILEELPMTAPDFEEETSGSIPPAPPKDADQVYYPNYDNPLEFCVILDAGHGGLDANGKYVTAPRKMFQHTKGTFHNGPDFYEGVWNRTMVAAIEKRLQNAGVHTIVLNHEVEDTSMTMRTKMANKYDGNYGRTILVSVHANSEPTSNARGFEIYTTGSEQSKELALLLEKSVKKEIGEKIKMRGIKQANFYMLTSTKMPALLVEHLFYSNFEDAQLLMKEEVIDAFATAYLEAILAYQKALV